MGKPISNITIVGGGTAGWLSALLLQSILNKDGSRRKPVTITLIESPDIPTVGVGEATVPGMPRTLKSAGISEQEFFKSCNTSFKLGVMFAGWNVDRSGKPIDYINPFARPGYINGTDTGYYFLKHGAGQLDFTQTFCPAVDLALAGKGPRALGATGDVRGLGYAYHLDAGKFAGMLTKICTERGVNHLRENVLDVELDERGYVSALQLDQSGRHEVELVIDCTGFKGVVINEVMQEPFISYSRYLANDRALALQIPHPNPAKIDSYTRSSALGAGWSWRVPLYNRIGTGYVFSSAHRTDEEAKAEFLAHLGDQAPPGSDPKVIPMRIGRGRNAWVRNVVAVGLSGGFIEPLESTAIHMIDTSIRWLTTYFPDSDFPDPLRNRFNKLVSSLYDEVRDFICLHYALGNRTDTEYWIDAREALEVPDSLAENLELWRYAMPGPFDLEFSSLFSVGTYQAVLMGKRVYETGYGVKGFADHIATPSAPWKDHVKRFRGQVGQLTGAMADHRALLREIRGEASEPGLANFAMAQPTVAMPGSNPAAPAFKLGDSKDAGLL